MFGWGWRCFRVNGGHSYVIGAQKSNGVFIYKEVNYY